MGARDVPGEGRRWRDGGLRVCGAARGARVPGAAVDRAGATGRGTGKAVEQGGGAVRARTGVPVDGSTGSEPARGSTAAGVSEVGLCGDGNRGVCGAPGGEDGDS